MLAQSFNIILQNNYMKVRIKELGRIVTGTTPKTSIKDYYSSNDYMFIGPSDLQNGKYIRKTEKHISTTAYSDYKSRFLNVGDICVSCIGYVGYIAKPTQLSLSNQQINSITQINENIVISDYLFYKLLSMNDYFQSINGNGSAVPIINKTIFENIEIDIHTLAEQQHIVDILGTLDEKIEKNAAIIEKLVLNLKLSFASHFSTNNILEKVPLIHFVKKTIGGDWGKDQEEKNFTEKVSCIRGADIPNVAKGQSGNPPIRYILPKNYQLKKLDDFDIIVEISGGSPTQSTGRSALITSLLLEEYNSRLICTNFCRAIKCKSKEYAAYFYSAFTKMYDDDRFFNYENGTTGIKNLDLQSVLEKEYVAMPNDKQLMSFYKLTNDTYSQISRYKSENSKLNELKQLYLKKFFG